MSGQYYFKNLRSISPDKALTEKLSQREDFCLQVGPCHVSEIFFFASSNIPSLDWLLDAYTRLLPDP